MSLKQGRYDILQENRNIGDTIWTHFINHNQNLNLMSDFNMTGENMDKEYSLTTSQFTNDFDHKTEPKEAKHPYKIGIGALFLWLVFVFLIVTVLWQDSKIDNLKNAIKTDANKIEFLKKELKLMYLGELLKRKNGN